MNIEIKSRPSRARGLKLGSLRSFIMSHLVAPLAGAWIETFGSARPVLHRLVAPLAGAWIETL